MKRAFAGIILCSVLAAGGVARAADAVSLAAQQEAEERYKRLTATMEEIQSAQLAQQRQISGLASDLSKLREDVARNNNNAANQEALHKLSEQILKVDESRIADNKRIQEAMEKLGKAIREMPSPPPVRPHSSGPSDGGTTSGGKGATARPSGNAPAAVEDVYEYVVQPGDRLDIIVKRYRDEKIMVTSKSIKDANPTVDWSRLKIGQKIIVPKPK